ncbi:MAG TPA: RcpC/CpaB family pilus assembly protein [Bacillota bacterium]|nr:RcpC/CpaB family pilus assembly protein [Bacillota bacterium]
MKLRPGNGSTWFVLMGVMVAALAAWWTWSVQESAHRTVDALVATQDVAPLQAILPADVRVVPVPIQAVPADALRDGSSVVGHYVRFGLLRGQVVRSANLTATQAGASQADAQLTSASAGSTDLRAVAIALQAVTGLDLPTPGDHVDLMAVVKGQGQVQARVIASDVLVLDRLAVGSSGNAPQALGAAQTLQQGALVLALTIPQAQQAALAEAMGQVEVMLDPLGLERGGTAPPPVDAGQWFGLGGK